MQGWLARGLVERGERGIGETHTEAGGAKERDGHRVVTRHDLVS